MKIIRRIIVGLLLIVSVALVAFILWGGQIIKQAVNTAGPQVMGVPVRLNAAHFRPLRGEVKLSGLFVGNPEGFKTESLFQMSNLEVDLDTASLFSDEIIINRILIDAPQITYEVGLKRNNIGVLLQGLEKEAAIEEEQPQEVAGDAPAKKVVIKELVLADARAQVSLTAMGGRVVPVQLATITLNDLGGEDQSPTQMAAQVMNAVLGAVVNAVAGAGDLLGDGVAEALKGAGALGGVALEGAGAVVGVAGEGTKAVAGAAGEGAKAVTGAAEEGSKAVGDAAGKGVKAVGGLVGEGTKGVRGLLGGREKEENKE